MRTVAHDRAAKLAARLSKLTIKVAPADHLEVLRNTVRVDEATWNLPVPIDGGQVAIVARAPGRQDWTKTVTIADEGASETIEIPALAPLGATPPPPVAVQPPPPKPPTSPHHRNLVPFIAAGAAVGLAGGAIGFHLWGNSIYKDAEDTTRSMADRTTSWHAANTRRYAAQTLAVGAVGCAAVAIVFALRGSRAHTESSVVALAPMITDGVGLQASGAW